MSSHPARPSARCGTRTHLPFPACTLPIPIVPILILLLSLLTASEARAQDESVPTVSINPKTTEVSSASLSLTVTFSDNLSLNTNTRSILLNGVEVSTGPGFSHTTPANGPLGLTTTSSGTVTLQTGANTISASICDGASPENCSFPTSRTYNYTPPPTPDTAKPAISVAPGTSTHTSASVPVTVVFSDNRSLNTATRKIYRNGDDVTGQLGHTAPSTDASTGRVTTTSSGTLTLGPDMNTVFAEICDTASPANCQQATVTYTYEPPPPPDTEKPSISLSPGSSSYTSDAVPATVTFGDNRSLSTSTRKIYQDGVDVTGQFSHTPVSTDAATGKVTTTSSGTLTLHAGTNTVLADICDDAANCFRSAGVLYTYNAPPAESGEPSVLFQPIAQTVTSPSLAVTVRFFDAVALETATREILLNGSPVTTLTHSTVAFDSTYGFTTTSSGTLTLQPGANILSARICRRTAGPCSVPSSVVHTYNAGTPQVQVSPDNGTATATAGTSKQHVFVVANPGTASGTYRLQPSCLIVATNATQAGCTVAAGTLITVPAGGAASVAVTAPAAVAGSTQRVRLSAEITTQSGVSDAGWIDVTVVGSGGTDLVAPSVSLVDLNQGPAIDRGACTAAPVAPGAAYECGDLRIAHPLPAHRTFNESRAPALTYNSQHAHPMPVVYADVTIPVAARIPPSVTVNVVLPDGTSRSATFPGGDFGPGAPRRVAVKWDGLQLATGEYPYTLQVTSNYDYDPKPSAPLPGTLVVVNRNVSPFGAGWWIAGWERLVCIDCGTGNRFLWIGGDGSTRIFERVAAGVLQSPNPAGLPDTIQVSATGYTRPLKGEAGRVEMDLQGRHVRTVDRFGHTTEFVVSATTGQLDTIRAPVPAGQAPRLWTLIYGDGKVTGVRTSAPGAPTRTVEIGYSTHGRLRWVIDADRDTTAFGFVTSASARVATLRDRRGTRHAFTYDAAGRLASSRLEMAAAPSAADLVTTFQAGESRGVGASVAAAQAYTLVDGPRTDVADEVRIWHTARGETARIRDPLGGETVLERGNPAYPALVTAVRAPNARGDSLVLRASSVYDQRGWLETSTLHDPAGAGDMVTRYTWDARWQSATRVKAPGADTVRIDYNAAGLPAFQEVGGALRRVEYVYDANGQVRAVRYPDPLNGTPGGGGVDSLFYDALGNLSRTRNRMGHVTLIQRDGLGRVTRSVSPVHAATAGDPAQVDATGVAQLVWYDLMGRDTLSQTWGPAVTFTRVSTLARVVEVPSEVVSVRKVYDAGGLLLRVERWATPDTARVGVLKTTYEYDAAGRLLREGDGVGGDEVYTWDQFRYDPAGNVERHVTMRGDTIRMEYDALGRMTRRILPPVTYGAKTVDCSDPPKAGSVGWTSCAFRFPIFANDASGGWTIPGDTAEFEFDAMGSMVRARNADALVTRSYYPGGALRTDSLRIRAYGSGSFNRHVFGIAYRYDGAGRVAALEHPANLAGTGAAQRDSFTYEPVRGALQSVISRTGLVFGYQYDLAGRLAAETFPGGLSNAFTYDGAGRRLTRTGVYNETHTYDARGKRLAVDVESVSTFRNYYSGLGMLTATEWLNQFNSFGQVVEEFRTDGLGHTAWRREAKQGSVGADPEYVTRYVPGSSRVSEVQFTFPRVVVDYRDSVRFSPDTIFRAYDPAGNVREGSHRGWTNGDGAGYRKVQTRAYFDAANRLRVQEAYDESNGMFFTGEGRGYASEYRYDALGRRVLARTRRDAFREGSTTRLCRSSNTAVDCTSGIERFVWAGGNILWEMRGPGGNTETADRLERLSSTAVEFGTVGYTHGGGLDRPLVVHKTDGARAGEMVVPHANWRGLYSKGTDPNGAQSTVPVEWPGFQTKAYHGLDLQQVRTRNYMGTLLEGRDASGQVYMRNRYYDPATGQFTQRDRIGLAGGLNTYGYAGGDPVNNHDPSGNSAESQSGGGTDPCETNPSLIQCFNKDNPHVLEGVQVVGRPRGTPWWGVGGSLSDNGDGSSQPAGDPCAWTALMRVGDSGECMRARGAEAEAFMLAGAEFEACMATAANVPYSGPLGSVQKEVIGIAVGEAAQRGIRWLLRSRLATAAAGARAGGTGGPWGAAAGAATGVYLDWREDYNYRAAQCEAGGSW